ncbi:MAG: S8 family serine peptidase [Phycisphaerales bacterium]|nr:S8 family serine peptidase [Phycisphaerales bacterium]
MLGIQLIQMAVIASLNISPDVTVLDPRLVEIEGDQWFQLEASESVLEQPALAIYVVLSNDVSWEAGEELIRAVGGQVISRIKSLKALVAEIPEDGLESLSRSDLVKWIEPALPPLTPTNNGARQVSLIDVAQDYPWNLDGSGVDAAMIEVNHPSSTHPDMAGRILQIGTGSSSGHPTHVAGTMIGDGTQGGGTYRGVAPEATLYSSTVYFSGFDIIFYTDPGGLESRYQSIVNVGDPAVFNQSMGSNVSLNGYPCSLLGGYGVTSALLDNIVLGSLGEPQVSVWSAGNERAYEGCTQEFGSIGPPAAAKNIISVGAIYSDTATMTSFSSWGPTSTGRIKPDVVAAGSQLAGDGGIRSCALGGGYEVRQGTSMSAPVVSGVIALMEQAFHAGSVSDETTPLPSTIRMILCHTAMDIGNVGPDYKMGWGLVDAEAAVRAMAMRYWSEASLSQSEQHVIPITVPSTGGDVSPLKVTIAWDDQPGADIVNDLDLILLAPDGSLHYPWTLDPADPDSPAQRNSPDHINVIEQVLVDDAVPGNWTIIVTGSSIANGSQSYSLITDGISQSGTLIRFEDLPQTYPEDQSLPVFVNINTDGEDLILSSTKLVYSVNDAPPVEAQLLMYTEPGQFYTLLPPMPCGATVKMYAKAESTETGWNFAPVDGESNPVELSVPVEMSSIYYDDFESDLGWTYENSADSGDWLQFQDPCHPAEFADSVMLHTGVEWCEYVVNGFVRATSPMMTLQTDAPEISFSYLYRILHPQPQPDLQVEYSVDGGQAWHEVTSIGCLGIPPSYPSCMGSFVESLAGFPEIGPTDSFQVRFTCYSNSTVRSDAVIAWLEIKEPCIDELDDCPADIANDDNLVNVDDLLLLLWYYGLEYAPADFNQNGLVDIDDLLTMIAAYAIPCP